MKKQILVLPSFFPSDIAKTKGIFVKEQLDLINLKYDVYVVYFIHHRLNPVKFLFHVLFRLNKNRLECISNHQGYKIWISHIKRIKKPSSSVLFWYQYLIDNLNLFIIKYRMVSLKKFLQNENIDIDLVHAHTVNFGGIAAYYFSKSYKTKYILTEHQALLNNHSYLINKTIEKVIRNSIQLVLVSSFQSSLLRLQGIVKEPIIAGNFVDEEIFKPLNASKEKFYILFITYHDDIKGNNTFIKSLEILRAKLGDNAPDVNLVISHDNRKIVESQIKKTGLKVNFHYSLDRKETIKIIQSCSVLVSTSYSETFGLSVCEALMCGKPAVVTASGGIDEMVTPENGIKVPVGDSTAVAEGIMKIMNGDLKYDPVKIRNSVLHKFGREAFLKKMENIYNKVLLGHNHNGNS